MTTANELRLRNRRQAKRISLLRHAVAALLDRYDTYLAEDGWDLPYAIACGRQALKRRYK